MKRMLAFLIVLSCVAVGPAAARDILVVPVPSAGAQYGSTATTAAVFSNLLADIAADMALKAARDHGPAAVHAFGKHGPALLKIMRNWTEAALNTGGRYAIQTWSGSKKFVPQLVQGTKVLGGNALAAGKGIAGQGFFTFRKDSEAAGGRTVAMRQTSSKDVARRSPKKTSGSGYSSR
jgi:hypothetical protein